MNSVSRFATLVLCPALLFGLTACERTSTAQQKPESSAKTDAGGGAKTGTSQQPEKSRATKDVALPADSKAGERHTTTQPGRIQAWQTAPLYAKVTGYVEKMHVDIGDEIDDVTQPLVTLRIPEMFDEEQQKLALEAQAEAQLAQAKAAVEVAKSQTKTADAKHVEAVAGLDRYVAAKKQWDSELERLSNLASDGSVTRKLVVEAQFRKDSSDAALKEAEARVESAKASRSEAGSAVQKAQADESAAVARLKVAAANRKYVQTMLEYAVVKPPFPGVVVERNVDAGHFVQPGDSASSKPLLVLAMTKTLRIVVEVPEAEAPYVRKGSPATVRIPVLKDQGELADLRVARTSFSLNRRNRTLRVEIDVPNKDGRLRPGMYAVAEIALDDAAETVGKPGR